MTVFSSLHPFTIGYDDVFKHFETLLEHQQPNYPPYNIVKTGDYTHCVEVALAGYSKADDVVVNDAVLKDGLLRVELERVVPEDKKPKVIKIK